MFFDRALQIAPSCHPERKTWSKFREHGEQRECREHGKDGKHQPGDLKVKHVFIQNSLFVTQNTLFGNQMTQSTLFYGFNVESWKIIT